MPARMVLARFKVSVSSAIRWQAQFRQSGRLVSGRAGGDCRSGRIETQAAFILSRYDAKSGTTLSELQAKPATRGVHVEIRTPWRFFDRQRVTPKKTAHAAEQERPDVAAARAA